MLKSTRGRLTEVLSHRLRWVVLTSLMVVIAVIVALALAGRTSIDNGNVVEGWRTYQNVEHAYQIEYPPGWNLQEEPTRCDDTFCVQSIELKHGGEGSVFVFVNFQGGWCEGSPGVTITEVVVSGYQGKEYNCPGFTIKGFGAGNSIIRYFPGANDKMNYLVVGQDRTDLGDVKTIVETFRFIGLSASRGAN